MVLVSLSSWLDLAVLLLSLNGRPVCQDKRATPQFWKYQAAKCLNHKVEILDTTLVVDVSRTGKVVEDAEDCLKLKE